MLDGMTSGAPPSCSVKIWRARPNAWVPNWRMSTAYSIAGTTL